MKKCSSLSQLCGKAPRDTTSNISAEVVTACFVKVPNGAKLGAIQRASSPWLQGFKRPDSEHCVQQPDKEEPGGLESRRSLAFLFTSQQVVVELF